MGTDAADWLLSLPEPPRQLPLQQHSIPAGQRLRFGWQSMLAGLSSGQL